MAVQAQQHLLSHSFLPHDAASFRALDGAAAVAGGFGPGLLEEMMGFGAVGCAAVVGGTARSDLTCVGGGGSGSDVYASSFMPRKRARVAAGYVEAAQQGLVLPLTVPHGQVFHDDVHGRAVTGGASGAASTSGRAAGGGAIHSQGVLSQLYEQGVEIDALVRFETERMQARLQDARRRHARAVLDTVERAAAGRLRVAEAELHRARHRNGELEERLRQLAAEGQAWLSVAKSHEAVAAGLRATLEQLLQQPAGLGGSPVGVDNAEDAQSCCFETSPAGDVAVSDDAVSPAASCKSCGCAAACVLVLPCRHLCLCRECEAAAGDACPVCGATKNASLHVLLS